MVTDESGIPPPYDDVIRESANQDAENAEGRDEVDKLMQNTEGAQEKNVSFA